MSNILFPSRRGKSGWRAGDDPLLVAEAIGVAESRERRFIAPLRVIRRTISDDVKESFLTETDPEGNPWDPWGESYADRAATENISILRKQPEYHRGGGKQLYDAATNLDNYLIRSKGVSSAAIGGGSIALIGSNLPDYWIYHQEGTSRIPARPFIGVSDAAEEIIFRILDMHVEGSLAGATRRGQPIFTLPGVSATFGSLDVFRVR